MKWVLNEWSSLFEMNFWKDFMLIFLKFISIKKKEGWLCFEGKFFLMVYVCEGREKVVIVFVWFFMVWLVGNENKRSKKKLVKIYSN